MIEAMKKFGSNKIIGTEELKDSLLKRFILIYVKIADNIIVTLNKFFKNGKTSSYFKKSRIIKLTEDNKNFNTLKYKIRIITNLPLKYKL